MVQFASLSLQASNLAPTGQHD